MIRSILYIASFILLSSCWPKSISFTDGSMPPEWKLFHLITLEDNSGNTPLSYALDLSEAIRSGIQNNTRLQISDNPDSSQVVIEGVITNYSITPVALQEGDNASQNRLTVTANFSIYTKEPEESEMNLSSSRFIDYDVNTDLGTVETELLSEVSDQIVQDVINKLLSNW